MGGGRKERKLFTAKYLVEHFYVCFFFVVVFVISCITTARHYLFIFLPTNIHTLEIKRKIPEDVFSTYNDALENNFFYSLSEEKNVSSLNGKLLFLE
jgi:hypothetical protein